MGMRIVNFNTANANFVKKENQIIQECEELAAAVSEAIEAVDTDTKDTWSFNGFTTNRVAYINVSLYLPETVSAVSAAFQEEGYITNILRGPGTNLLIVIWDPNAPASIFNQFGVEYEEYSTDEDEDEDSEYDAVEDEDGEDEDASDETGGEGSKENYGFQAGSYNIPAGF